MMGRAVGRCVPFSDFVMLLRNPTVHNTHAIAVTLDPLKLSLVSKPIRPSRNVGP